MRYNNRDYNEIRNVKITKDYIIQPEGSVLIEMGSTKIICNATVEEKIPMFLKGKSQGWLTAEYSMLPRATDTRNMRESIKGKLSGRTMEIQRLIGRSLRAAINLKKLGERSIIIDCDVIQADGGTRTASITGGYIALSLAIKKLLREGKIKENPLIGNVAAISAGIVKGRPLLDLEYTEDSVADVDINIVMRNDNKFIEIQGTGEEDTYDRNELNELLDLGEKGIRELINIQNEVINNKK